MTDIPPESVDVELSSLAPPPDAVTAEQIHLPPSDQIMVTDKELDDDFTGAHPDPEAAGATMELLAREPEPGTSGSYPFPVESEGAIRPYHVNPFKNDAVCMITDWFKSILVAGTLFPLRLAVLLLSLVLGMLAITIAGLGFERGSYNPTHGISWLRTVLLSPVRLCARGILFAFSFWWINVDVEGNPSPVDAPVLVVASHCSTFELLYFIYQWQPMFLCHTTVQEVPFLGKCAQLMEAVFVERLDETSRREALTTIDQCLTRTKPRPIIFFPEGTWTNGQCLIAFKTAAFRLGFPVLPIALQYPHTSLNVAAVGRAGTCFFMLRMMLQLYNRMDVHQLGVHTPTLEEIKNPSLFADNVRRVIARKLELETTEHTHEDSHLMELTQDCGYHLRNAAATLDVASVQQHCDISAEALFKLLHTFKELDLDSTGRLDYRGFLAVTELPETAYSHNLFQYLDPSRSARVTFADYVQRLTVIKNKQAAHQRMQLAYLLCNKSGSGKLTLAEMDAACENVNVPEARKMAGMQMLVPGSRGGADWIRFDLFAQWLDQNREVLNMFLLSPSNPLLKLIKWH